MGVPRPSQQIERGDFQTPEPLARAVCALVSRLGPRPGSIVEPTCGRGAFLEAAADAFPDARLHGLEIEPAYAAEARSRAPGARVEVVDAFTHPWEAWLPSLPGPVLLLGNPPWVTSAAVGRLRGDNLPERRRRLGERGIDALTGRSNFDVSEWLLRTWLAALPVGGGLAMLCKASVARRLLVDAPDFRARGFYRIPASSWFGAGVDAGLLVAERAEAGGDACPVHDDLDAPETSRWGLRAGRVVADVELWDRARAAAAHGLGLTWRSGVKHDCARVLEVRDGVNGLGEPVNVEPDRLYPLLKSTDLHRGRPPARSLLLPQHHPGEPPGALPPRTRAYLEAHRSRLDARRSRIYSGGSPYAVFGVGPYSFSPWKLAVSGLHLPARFRLVGPARGRPVVFDDTCYLATVPDEQAGRRALASLTEGPPAEMLRAAVFPGDKRPITKALLTLISN